MSLASRLRLILDVSLRVPPLFLLDVTQNGSLREVLFSASDDLISLSNLAWVIVYLLSWCVATVLFVIPTKHLLDTYQAFLPIVTLSISLWLNLKCVQNGALSPSSEEGLTSVFSSNPSQIIANIVVQIALAYCYNCSKHNPLLYYRISQPSILVNILNSGAVTYACFLQTIICQMVSFPSNYLQFIPILSIVLAKTAELKLLYVDQLPTVIRTFYQAYGTIRYMLNVHGIQTFLETHWIRLKVPSVLRVFWTSRVILQFATLCGNTLLMNMSNPDYHPLDFWLFKAYINFSDLIEILKIILISGCETVIALSGMTSMVSYITHYLSLLFIAFLKSDNEEDRNMGTMSAILFFVLALQTGLTGMTPEMRLIRLYRNFCLLSTAVLHFIHGMVHPQLMTLSASHNMSLNKHLRALTLCLALVTLPAMFLSYLWSQHSVSTWLLAVTAFSIEVIIKVSTSLIIYTLFMVNNHLNTFWEGLDDYVYYIKSTGNSIEFLFGIFLFCNGAWIMVFESGGMIRALMMCIHAYFNIWVQAKEGWKVFMKRRTAVDKINLLALATPAQLRAHNDVCAICYQELNNARITSCNHMFHGVCLRKWLYVQDECPLCHQLIFKVERTLEDEVPNGHNVNGDAPQVHRQ